METETVLLTDWLKKEATKELQKNRSLRRDLLLKTTKIFLEEHSSWIIELYKRFSEETGSEVKILKGTYEITVAFLRNSFR